MPMLTGSALGTSSMVELVETGLVGVGVSPVELVETGLVETGTDSMTLGGGTVRPLPSVRVMASVMMIAVSIARMLTAIFVGRVKVSWNIGAEARHGSRRRAGRWCRGLYGEGGFNIAWLLVSGHVGDVRPRL